MSHGGVAMMARDWIALAQLLVIVVGGAWAYYQYRLSRQGHTSVGIEHSSEVVDVGSGRPVLIVSLRVTNTARVLFFYESATATLMDASTRTQEGAVRLLPFAEQDPFVLVYGREASDEQAVRQGRLFEIESDQVISLEPQEAVDMDLAFPLTTSDVGLMAMQVRIQGHERKAKGDPYIWSSFFFIRPTRRREGDSDQA